MAAPRVLPRRRRRVSALETNIVMNCFQSFSFQFFNLRRYIMALFFFHVGLEIKREIAFGSLSNIKVRRFDPRLTPV